MESNRIENPRQEFPPRDSYRHTHKERKKDCEIGIVHVVRSEEKEW